jgi:tetratricopeptide (TPR) repeat protein
MASRDPRIVLEGSTRSPVKELARTTGWSRHFEGWQPALLALLLAGSTAALAIPRSIAPIDLPEPRLDPGALRHIENVDADLAASADRVRLDIDVLKLGTQLFAYGVADAERDDEALATARRDVLDASLPALRVGTGPMLALRAHHLRTFLREMARYDATGEETLELRQVAGGILHRLEHNGWLDPTRAHHRVLPDATVLAILFKKHWNEVVGVAGEPFESTLPEARAFYRFLLAHPALPDGAGSPGLLDARASITGQYRLKKIDELAALDHDYPMQLARGVVYFQLGRFPLAVEAFRRHLESRPDGPYTFRAQNYLRAALGRSHDEP